MQQKIAFDPRLFILLDLSSHVCAVPTEALVRSLQRNLFSDRQRLQTFTDDPGVREGLRDVL